MLEANRQSGGQTQGLWQGLVEKLSTVLIGLLQSYSVVVSFMGFSIYFFAASLDNDPATVVKDSFPSTVYQLDPRNISNNWTEPGFDDYLRQTFTEPKSYNTEAAFKDKINVALNHYIQSKNVEPGQAIINRPLKNLHQAITKMSVIINDDDKQASGADLAEALPSSQFNWLKALSEKGYLRRFAQDFDFQHQQLCEKANLPGDCLNGVYGFDKVTQQLTHFSVRLNGSLTQLFEQIYQAHFVKVQTTILALKSVRQPGVAQFVIYFLYIALSIVLSLVAAFILVRSMAVFWQRSATRWWHNPFAAILIVVALLISTFTATLYQWTKTNRDSYATQYSIRNKARIETAITHLENQVQTHINNGQQTVDLWQKRLDNFSLYTKTDAALVKGIERRINGYSSVYQDFEHDRQIGSVLGNTFDNLWLTWRFSEEQLQVLNGLGSNVGATYTGKMAQLRLELVGGKNQQRVPGFGNNAKRSLLNATTLLRQALDEICRNVKSGIPTALAHDQDLLKYYQTATNSQSVQGSMRLFINNTHSLHQKANPVKVDSLDCSFERASGKVNKQKLAPLLAAIEFQRQIDATSRKNQLMGILGSIKPKASQQSIKESFINTRSQIDRTDLGSVGQRLVFEALLQQMRTYGVVDESYKAPDRQAKARLHQIAFSQVSSAFTTIFFDSYFIDLNKSESLMEVIFAENPNNMDHSQAKKALQDIHILLEEDSCSSYIECANYIDRNMSLGYSPLVSQLLRGLIEFDGEHYVYATLLPGVLASGALIEEQALAKFGDFKADTIPKLLAISEKQADELGAQAKLLLNGLLQPRKIDNPFPFWLGLGPDLFSVLIGILLTIFITARHHVERTPQQIEEQKLAAQTASNFTKQRQQFEQLKQRMSTELLTGETPITARNLWQKLRDAKYKCCQWQAGQVNKCIGDIVDDVMAKTTAMANDTFDSFDAFCTAFYQNHKWVRNTFISTEKLKDLFVTDDQIVIDEPGLSEFKVELTAVLQRQLLPFETDGKYTKNEIEQYLRAHLTPAVFDLWSVHIMRHACCSTSDFAKDIALGAAQKEIMIMGSLTPSEQVSTLVQRSHSDNLNLDKALDSATEFKEKFLQQQRDAHKFLLRTEAIIDAHAEKVDELQKMALEQERAQLLISQQQNAQQSAQILLDAKDTGIINEGFIESFINEHHYLFKDVLDMNSSQLRSILLQVVNPGNEAAFTQLMDELNGGVKRLVEEPVI